MWDWGGVVHEGLLQGSISFVSKDSLQGGLLVGRETRYLCGVGGREGADSEK